MIQPNGRPRLNPPALPILRGSHGKRYTFLGLADIVDRRELSKIVLGRKDQLKSSSTRVNRSECKRHGRVESHWERRVPFSCGVNRTGIVRRIRSNWPSQQLTTDIGPRTIHHDFANQIGQPVSNDMDLRVESHSDIGKIKF